MAMNHIVSSFDEELNYLEEKVLFMGNFAIAMINDAIKAMVTQDADLARDVIQRDQTLDNTEREIDEKATNVIARRQPMAVDLRLIIGNIRIATDLERIGDKAKNLAKRSLVFLSAEDGGVFDKELQDFASLAVSQLKHTMEAYKDRSLAMIKEVIIEDDKTDACYKTMFGDILQYMVENPKRINYCTQLLFCAKNIERVGDHATNIVETLYYIIKGDFLPLETREFIEKN